MRKAPETSSRMISASADTQEVKKKSLMQMGSRRGRMCDPQESGFLFLSIFFAAAAAAAAASGKHR